VTGWFEGIQLYKLNANAVYPPASYLMMWPLVGWLGFAGARILYGVVIAACVLQLSRGFRNACGVESRYEKRLLFLVPLATYPVGATIGNGQLGIFVVLSVMAAIPLLWTAKASWKRDALIAALFLIALVKPTLAAPFFLVILLLPGGFRPATLTVLGYAALTWIASFFQTMNPLQLMDIWFRRSVSGSQWGALNGEGSIRLSGDGTLAEVVHVNLHSVLGAVGLSSQIALASFAVVALLGAWIFLRRQASPWLLLGVVAIVTRFYTYHGWYDDVLMLLPLIALAQVTKDQSNFTLTQNLWARGLFLALVVSMLAPSGGYLLPSPWSSIFVLLQTLLFLGSLLFLVRLAKESHQDVALR